MHFIRNRKFAGSNCIGCFAGLKEPTFWRSSWQPSCEKSIIKRSDQDRANKVALMKAAQSWL